VNAVRTGGRLRLKCDGTRAETRFRLSAKRTSPFRSAGASVQSTTGSRGVRISGNNAGYPMFRGYWLPTPFASFSFTSPPVRHRVPSHSSWILQTVHHVENVGNTMLYILVDKSLSLFKLGHYFKLRNKWYVC
jgi:hypothetical protein